MTFQCTSCNYECMRLLLITMQFLLWLVVLIFWCLKGRVKSRNIDKHAILNVHHIARDKQFPVVPRILVVGIYH